MDFVLIEIGLCSAVLLGTVGLLEGIVGLAAWLRGEY